MSALRRCSSVSSTGGGAADRGGDQAGVAGQDLQGFVSDPVLRLRVAFGVEAPGCFPHVFQDVDEVDDDGDGDVPGSGVGFDLVDLVVVAVDRGDPGLFVVGVAAVGLVEDRRDDLCGGVGDAVGEPLADSFWSGGLRGGAVGVTGGGGGQGDDVRWGARCWDDLVDRADLGHAFTVAFLPFGQSGAVEHQPAGQFLAGGRLRGGRAQRVGAQHDALAVKGQGHTA